MKQTIHTRTLIKRHMALGITALALGVTAAAVSVIPSNAAAKLSSAKATVCLKDETCKAVKQKITLKGTNKTYTVKVANSKIASVKKSGKTITITGKKTGSTVLSVKVKNGKTLKCKIAVKNHSYNEAVMNDSNGKEYTLYTCKYCGSSYEERVTEIEEGYSMNLADYASQWKYIAEYDCYGLENVVYCTNPKTTTLQSMNIYVPAAYMNADGTIKADGTVNGYTAQTAPIIYKNGIAGYMEAAPNVIGASDNEYMQEGFIYVSVGSRGRGTQAEDGTYIGKSPEGLVDLKAGIRFLKANSDVLAGDTNKIISVGTSAGGAMSSLLGTTGNSTNYDSYLQEIGAVMDQTDDVYASQCYCPITDLENADLAYEWMYVSDTHYEGFLCPSGDLSEFQQALSKKLASEYPAYYNSLGLVDANGNALTLGEDGRSGSGYEYIMGVIEDAATTYLTKLTNGEIKADYSVEDYIKGNYTYTSFDMMSGQTSVNQGRDLSGFLTWDGTKATITDLDAFVQNYRHRLKTCLAYDDLELAEAENQELGNATVDLMHFSEHIAPAIESLKDEYPAEYDEYYSAYSAVSGDSELAARKYLINPLNYIGTDEQADTAKHFRIRVGTYDGHTSFTVAMNLALKLAAEEDTDVDYAMVWDEDHGDADYAGEFSAWVERITK
jgi:hypothetical protein